MLDSFRSAIASRPSYKYWVFGAIALGTFGSVVDHGSSLVALPTIVDHFGTDIPTVQWVVIAYTLTITALLLPMGRLSDLVGRRKVYLFGTLVFVLGAGMSGSSVSLEMLIGSRIIQGVGAAMTQGTGMAIITSVFPSNQRGKAIGFIMTVVGAGGIAGPAIGGLLVQGFDWPYVFWINIPLGLLGIATVLVILQEKGFGEDSRQQGSKFDWPGAALSSGALLTLLLAMTNGYRSGWTSLPILLALAGFFVLITSFIWWESRTPNPMLDVKLFGSKAFSLGVSASFLTFLGSASVLFLMPFYLQGVMGLSPRSAGLIVMPGALCLAFMGPVSGMLSDRFGWRWFTVGGLASSAAGLFLLSRLTTDSTLIDVFPALILTSGGMGVFYSANSSSVLSAVEMERYGVVSALLNLVRNGGNIVSLALATIIVTTTMGSLGFEPSLEVVRDSVRPDVGHAFSAGMRNAFLTMMGLLLIALAVSAVKSESEKEREAGPILPSGVEQTPD